MRRSSRLARHVRINFEELGWLDVFDGVLAVDCAGAERIDHDMLLRGAAQMVRRLPPIELVHMLLGRCLNLIVVFRELAIALPLRRRIVDVGLRNAGQNELVTVLAAGTCQYRLRVLGEGALRAGAFWQLDILHVNLLLARLNSIRLHALVALLALERLLMRLLRPGLLGLKVDVVTACLRDLSRCSGVSIDDGRIGDELPDLLLATLALLHRVAIDSWQT